MHPDRIEIDLVITSTAQNYNGVYYELDVFCNSDITKLEFNFNHEKPVLSNTKLVKIWTKMVHGELELHGTVISTNREVISKRQGIISCSTETRSQVENQGIIRNFTWTGLALLIHYSPGNSRSRILDIRECY